LLQLINEVIGLFRPTFGTIQFLILMSIETNLTHQRLVKEKWPVSITVCSWMLLR